MADSYYEARLGPKKVKVVKSGPPVVQCWGGPTDGYIPGRNITTELELGFQPGHGGYFEWIDGGRGIRFTGYHAGASIPTPIPHDTTTQQ